MLKVTGLLIGLLLNSILLNRSIIINKTIRIPNYVVGFVFIILLFPIIYLTHDLSIILITMMIILIYDNIVKFSNEKGIKQSVFKSGFFLGILLLFDFSFLFYYVLILIAIIHYNVFNWRNITIQIIGLLYPVFINYIFILLELDLLPSIVLNAPSKDIHQCFKAYPEGYFFSCVLLILSLKELYLNYHRKTEYAKKTFDLLLLMCCLILIQTLFLNSLLFSYILSIPFAIIISNYLIYVKHPRFRTFLLGLLIMSFLFKFLNT